MASDAEFYGTVSAQPATASDHLTRLDQLQAEIAAAKNRVNHTGADPDPSVITGIQAYVDGRISSVLDIAGAPSTLDTLNELAAALGDDANFAATTASSLGALDSRIDVLEANAGVGGDVIETIGDGVASIFTVTHNLNAKVAVDVVRISDGQTVYPTVKRPAMSLTAVSIDFGSFVPANNAFEVYVSPRRA